MRTVISAVFKQQLFCGETLSYALPLLFWYACAFLRSRTNIHILYHCSPSSPGMLLQMSFAFSPFYSHSMGWPQYGQNLVPICSLWTPMALLDTVEQCGQYASPYISVFTFFGSFSNSKAALAMDCTSLLLCHSHQLSSVRPSSHPLTISRSFIVCSFPFCSHANRSGHPQQAAFSVAVILHLAQGLFIHIMM